MNMSSAYKCILATVMVPSVWRLNLCSYLAYIGKFFMAVTLGFKCTTVVNTGLLRYFRLFKTELWIFLLDNWELPL